MNYFLMFYAVSAVLAATCLVPYCDLIYDFVFSPPTRDQPFFLACAAFMMVVLILAPGINTLFALHSVDCYFRYPQKA